MTVVVRFAPSPTGRLHVGNARLALVNWLYARGRQGRFILRLDDTDRERSREEYAQGIEHDLAWLGLDWDALVRQSDRMDRYEAAFDRLRNLGVLYPCYETPQELELRRKVQLARGEPPRYDRAALRLSEADRERLEWEGRKPHWRFLLGDGDVIWRDLVRGDVRFEAPHLSDPVLFREDGRPLYTLSSVVDDAELGITHVIRGEDHVANTAVQIKLFAALGVRPEQITFAHLSLLTDASGGPLSKRAGSLSLETLRESGIEAAAITSLLARLGTADPVVPTTDVRNLSVDFDITRFGRASPRFDPEELDRVNAVVLHRLEFPAVAERLRALDMEGFSEPLWLAVRENLVRLADAAYWYTVCCGELEPTEEADPGLTAAAAGLLPEEPWNDRTWKHWTDAVKEATGRKGKELFRPLRLALTGRERGPELRVLLPLIGRERADRRLRHLKG